MSAVLPPGKPYTVTPDQGRVVELRPVRMRVLAAGEGTTDRAFTLVEFTGDEGTWTVPHLHRETEESFFVLDGRFTVGVGDEEVRAGPGTFVLVPRATRHVVAAGPGGGRCLVLMVPGGHEEMFFELGELGADAIRDPGVRAAISARHDSVPV